MNGNDDGERQEGEGIIYLGEGGGGALQAEHVFSIIIVCLPGLKRVCCSQVYSLRKTVIRCAFV